MTFALMNGKTICHAQTPNRRIRQNGQKRKEPTHLGPPDNTVSHHAVRVPTVQMRADSSVAEQWINGHDAMGKKYGDKKIGGRQKVYSRS